VEPVHLVHGHEVQQLQDERHGEEVAPNVKQHPPPHEPWAIKHLQDNWDGRTCRTIGMEGHAGQLGWKDMQDNLGLTVLRQVGMAS